MLHSGFNGAPRVRKSLALAACGFFLLWNWDIGSAEMQAAGVVKSIKGEVVIFRSGQALEVGEGMRIFMGDRVQTAETGSVGLIFSDDSLVSMGPASEMVVSEYHFVPIENKLSFVIRIFRGTIAYLSGQISKLSPESVRLETPVMTIGVRGTQVLVKQEG